MSPSPVFGAEHSYVITTRTESSKECEDFYKKQHSYQQVLGSIKVEASIWMLAEAKHLASLLARPH